MVAFVALYFITSNNKKIISLKRENKDVMMTNLHVRQGWTIDKF